MSKELLKIKNYSSKEYFLLSEREDSTSDNNRKLFLSKHDGEGLGISEEELFWAIKVFFELKM